MSNGEHEIRTPKGLRIGNRSVVDVEVFSLVASTMKKMRSISDMEFSRLDLKPYLQDVVAK